MINRVVLMGRVATEIELKKTPNGTSVAQFSVAVERSYAKQGEEKQTDFIMCVAWQKTAEFISKFFSKGRMIALEGNLRTRNYEDSNGSKHYVTEVYIDSVSFTGEAKKDDNGNSTNQSKPKSPPPQKSVAVTEEDVQTAIGDLGDFEEVLSDGPVPF